LDWNSDSKFENNEIISNFEYSVLNFSESNSSVEPGRGRKLFLDCNLKGKTARINLVLDTGSSTSLVSKHVVVTCNLPTRRTKTPITFTGIGGRTCERREIALLEIEILEEKLVVPVYVVDQLPGNIDILVGMDQIGKNLGLEIPIGESKLDYCISIKSGKRITKILLVKAEDDGIRHNNDSQNKSRRDRELRPGVKTFERMGINGTYLERKICEEWANEVGQSREIKSLRDESEVIAVESSNIGDEGLDTNGQSKDIELETPGETKFDKFASFNDRLTSLAEEAKALRLGIGDMSGKLSKLQRDEILSENPTRKRGRNGNRKSIRENQAKMDDIKNEIVKSREELDMLHKALDQVVSKIRKTTKALERKNRSEQNRDFRKILKTLDRVPIIPKDKEEIGFVRITADKEDAMVEENIADFSGEYERRESKIFHSLRREESDELLDLVRNYSDVIISKEEAIPMGQANIGEEFDIELKEGALDRLAKNRAKAYPIKGEFRTLLDKTLDEMERVGVGVNNPPNFNVPTAAPTFFAKNKSKWRMVHDFKPLNDETVDMIYPIPLISTILESLKGKKYFSIIDLKSGYYQFKLSERAKKLCAVISPKGIFQFGCLPMGLKNAPPFFQKIMERILKEGLNIYVFVYIDDIIIYSNTFQEHMGHLAMVLEMLREANLKANIEKCAFCLSQLRVLGKVISGEGIQTDPDLVKSMVEFPVPTSARKVKGFLAMLNFYRDHLEDFGPKTEPLAKLARDDFKWDKNTWNSDPKYQKCFDELKGLMLRAPILAYPDFLKKFYIQSDSSLYGAGAVLYQYNDEERRNVVAYASWLFNTQQRKYNTTERELLAIVLATRKWKPYLRRSHFIAETDHQPLEGYLDLKDPYGKIARWSAELSQFYFTVKYIKGITNIPPDVLSRIHEEALFFECIRTSRVLSEISLIGTEEQICCLETIEEEILLEQLNFSWPSDAELIEAYKYDEKLAYMYEYIKSNKVPEAVTVNGITNDQMALEILRTAHLFLIGNDGKLYHYADKKNKPNKLVLCVPKKYVRLVLEECHDSVWAGAHMGRDKTFDKIKEKYYFNRMKDYTNWYVRSCVTCQQCKRKNPAKSMPWAIIEAKHTWDLLCIDLWDSGVVSSEGNKYVLTVIDGFSKFAFAIPLRNKEAKSVAKALVRHVFNLRGPPRRLHSDRGSEFVNEIITNLVHFYSSDKSNTTAYHPQGNAYAERIHQFFRNALTAYVNRSQRDWDSILPILMPVYNNSIHEALGGHSPSQLMFGVNVDNTPIQLPLGDEIVMSSKYVYSLKLALDRVQQIVMEKTYKKMQKNMMQNGGYKYENYQVGDKVALSVECLPSGFSSIKLYPRWKGPYEVINLSRDGRVLYLKDAFGEELNHPVSILRVKRWYDRDDSSISMELDEQSASGVQAETNPQIEELQKRPTGRIGGDVSDLEDKDESSEELQKRPTGRIGGDVSTTQDEISNGVTRPSNRRGKDWSFIDTREFQKANNQKVKFIGRSPRIARGTKIDYSKEKIILWLEF
jgi:hypothetical protein